MNEENRRQSLPTRLSWSSCETPRSIECILIAFNGLRLDGINCSSGIFSNRYWPVIFPTTWRQVMKLGRKLSTGSIALAALVSLSSGLHAQTAGTCLYESKSYSEGASICLRSAMMLSCRAEGARLIWSIVTDQDVNRLCGSPVVSGYRKKAIRTGLKKAPRPVQPAAAAAKCFQFNGRTYCE